MKGATVRPLVCVKWGDAYVAHEEYTLETIPRGPLVVETYGMIVREDAEEIAIAGEYIPEQESYRAVTIIPRVLVRSVESIQPKRVRRKTPPRSPAHTPAAE